MKKIFCFLILCLMLFSGPLWSKGGAEPEPEPETKGEVVAVGGLKEAPMLAEMVASGELPPVKERLPDDPVVMETVEATGKYGGQLRVFNSDWVPRTMWGNGLLRVPRNGVGSDPDLAAGYEIAEDRLSLTLFLRPGAKWSDGHPFTAEDIRFMYDDMHNYKAPERIVRTNHATGNVTETEVIDEYAIKLITPGGVGTLALSLASWQGCQTNAFQPAHYLKKWHIEYNPDAEKVAKEEGFETWYDAMGDHYNWDQPKDFDLPMMTAWTTENFSTTAELYERNPYYWKIDEAGNQLPYIDSVIVQQVSPEVYQLKVSNGEADFAWAFTSVDNLSLYTSGEETYGYKVVLHPGIAASLVKLDIAQTHEDPVLREIFSSTTFRQAISVAVDRQDINRAVYKGLGVPRQYAPLETTSYYKEEWGQYYAQYDPDLANQLLDEIGLDKKDSQGYRMRPDGETLSIVIEFHREPYTPVLELVREYWQAVGLKTTIKMADVGLIVERMMNNQLFAWVHGNINIPRADERAAFMSGGAMTSGDNQRAWRNWVIAKRDYLRELLPEGEVLPVDYFTQPIPAEVEEGLPGMKPPLENLEMRTVSGKWVQTDMGSAEYKRLAQQYYDYHVYNLSRIGFVGEVPDVAIVSNRLKNVPPPGWVNGLSFEFQYIVQWSDQFYLE